MQKCRGALIDYRDTSSLSSRRVLRVGQLYQTKAPYHTESHLNELVGRFGAGSACSVPASGTHVLAACAPVHKLGRAFWRGRPPALQYSSHSCRATHQTRTRESRLCSTPM
jgi:hypothetical protein